MATGKVSNHDNNICEITLLFVFPVFKPIPKIEPTLTCVVETGNPKKLAATTIPPVIKFALNACP